jgi:hypothetical protein
VAGETQAKLDASLISSKAPPLWLLALRGDRRRALDFLLEAVNCLRFDTGQRFPSRTGAPLEVHLPRPETLRRLRRRYPEFCPRAFETGEALGKGDYGSFLVIQDRLRSAWQAPTTEERDLWINGLLADVVRYSVLVSPQAAEAYLGEAGRLGDDAWSGLAWAIHQALRVSDSMRICANVDCDARYFIAKRRTQKYCCEKCAGPAKRAAQKAWWAEHGSTWRRARKRAKAKKGRGTKQARKRG